jgi:AraC-like DNA-binding protein
MKPIIEKIPQNQELSFRAEVYYDHWFTMPLHIHPQYEIVYITKGYGKRIIGDSYDDFEKGDLAMTAANLPHFWRSHPDFYNNPELFSKSIFIQFSYKIFPEDRKNQAEFQFINNALEISKHGIKISGTTCKFLLMKMKTILNKKGIDRILLLYQILDMIGRSPDIKLLCSKTYINSFQHVEDKRLKKVLDFLQDNYCKQITLAEISNLAGMNSSSFCRYFRQKMQRTLMEYIYELRIDYACKLMSDKQLTITYVAYECGFNSMSFFNDQFKRIRGVTPSIFRKQLILYQ